MTVISGSRQDCSGLKGARQNQCEKSEQHRWGRGSCSSISLGRDFAGEESVKRMELQQQREPANIYRCLQRGDEKRGGRPKGEADRRMTSTPYSNNTENQKSSQAYLCVYTTRGWPKCQTHQNKWSNIILTGQELSNMWVPAARARPEPKPYNEVFNMDLNEQV